MLSSPPYLLFNYRVREFKRINKLIVHKGSPLNEPHTSVRSSHSHGKVMLLFRMCSLSIIV